MEKEVDHLIINLNGNDPELVKFITQIKNLDLLMNYPWSDNNWSSLHESQHYWLSLLILEDQVRAFSLFSRIGDELHLLKILVDPACQGVGLGKKLLKVDFDEHFIDWESCFLEVREDNFSAIKLYSNLGFKLLHKVNSFYSDGCTALKMSLTYSNS